MKAKHGINTAKVLQLARNHVHEGDMASSARSCMKVAMESVSDGFLTRAAYWGLQSLAYSVGICHADYKKAFNLCKIDGPVRLVGIWESA